MANATSEDAAAAFAPLRPTLIRAAHRMLGSVTDAEDALVGLLKGGIVKTTALLGSNERGRGRPAAATRSLAAASWRY
jgi:hypothetical protein